VTGRQESQDEPDSSADVDRSAALLFDESQPKAVRDAAAAVVIPWIVQAQRPILGRAGLHDRAGFIEEAATYVFLQAKKLNVEGMPTYEPTRPFQRWCRRVLKNRVAEAFRRRKRKTRVDFAEDLASIAVDGGGASSCPAEAGWLVESLPDADLEFIREWKPVVRLVLLLPSGLWPKLPDDLKEQTADDHGADLNWDEGTRRRFVERMAAAPREELPEIQHAEWAALFGLPSFQFSRIRTSQYWRLYSLTAFRDVFAFPTPGPDFLKELFAEARRRYRCGDPGGAVSFDEGELALLGGADGDESGAGAPHGWTCRCLLLAMADLWRRVPEADWSGWVSADGLPSPFPPADFDPDADFDEKAGRLEHAFSMRPKNAMKQKQILSNFRGGFLKLISLPSIGRIIRRREPGR